MKLTFSILILMLNMLIMPVIAQNQSYKSIPFAKPMDLPFDLAGCFAEPRPAHFHSGIDIKTNEKEGYPVYAIYDGYISRIKVSAFGYGKALYITHTNGFTSVYGHLSRFTDEIEKYVHDEIYKQQLSEIDIYPASNKLPVKKEQQVAYSGNTGGSSGPHLHFEIRDTKTEHALNPILFNYAYKDNQAPTISELKIYNINESYYSAETNAIKLKKIDDYLSPSGPVVATANTIGFSLKGYDAQENSTNKNGIYRIELYANNILQYAFTQDEIDFSTTRGVAAFVDFKEQCTSSLDNYLCFKLPNNPLKIFDNLSTTGILRVKDKDTLAILIRCFDVNKNETQVRFKLTVNLTPKPSKKNAFNYAKKNLLQKPKCHVSFPENTFYDHLTLSYAMDTAKKSGIYSSIHKIGNNQFIPLYKSSEIEIMSRKLPVADRNKACIVVRNHKGKEKFLTTETHANWLTAQTKELGDFYIKTDKEKPQISLLNARQDSFKDNRILVKITDTRSGIKSYVGYIDGNWINFYYDAKEDTIEYQMDEFCKSGTHELKIIVTDQVNNQTIFTQTFKN
ncbi:MAG TPA: M23 family metallopeptidase [Chitinophagales bacterium]|nr:M23 family metallopeptidase [Chitinophagales bacterium]